jgi:hypothetical protein
MAFSPFNIFRRNQKAIFAVITVFIMFTFVLSSGLGGGADFFDWFPNWLRSASNRGDLLCTIDGTRVYSKDVAKVEADRTLANHFMYLVAKQSSFALLRDVQEKLADANPTLAKVTREFLSGGRADGFMQAAMIIGSNPKAPPRDQELIQTVRLWAELDQHWKMAESRDTLYFFNSPKRTPRDTVNFMLWLKAADRLGVTLTDEDVNLLIYRESLGVMREYVPIQEAMAQTFGSRYTPAAVRRALAAEFRVRAAQTALLGPVSQQSERTATHAPIFPTPFDLYAFYRDKTAPVTYQVLAVPAASYADKMTAAPTDAEVERLFKERKDYEPDPSKDEPGFKEPRKVKVEWAAATGDEPYYQKAAVDWVKNTEFFTKGASAAAAVPVPGVGLGGWAAQALAPAAGTELLLYAEYQRKVTAHKVNLADRWSGAFGLVMPYTLLDSSFELWTKRAPRTPDDDAKKRPVAAAGPELAAQLTALGAAGIGGSIVVQPAGFYAQAVAHEARDRGIAGTVVALAGLPTPGLLPQIVGAEVAFRASLPAAPPLAAVRAELLAELQTAKARDLAVADLRKLQTELTKLSDNGRAKDKGAAAREFAAAFIKERAMRTGATAAPVSEWTIRDDPGLAPLREAFTKTAAGMNPHSGMNVPFGQKFFYTTDPIRGTRSTSTGLYVPEFYPEMAAMRAGGNKEPLYLAWRTEDKKAESLSLTDARPRVVEAWKRLKARDEAKAAADRLAGRIKAIPGDNPVQFVPALFDLQAELQKEFPDQKAKDRVKLFRLENVAPIQILNEQAGAARLFTLAGNQDIPYATVEMGKKLIDSRDAGAKTTFVAPDAPKDTYYLFVLSGRQERGVEEFRQHVYPQMGFRQVRDLVLGLQAQEMVTRTTESVLGLLKKEFNYVETDDQKPKLDEKTKD